jgi:hypothetical protein
VILSEPQYFVVSMGLTAEWYQTFTEEGPGLKELLTIKQLSPSECD